LEGLGGGLGIHVHGGLDGFEPGGEGGIGFLSLEAGFEE